MLDTLDRLDAFIHDFETCQLTRARWTHHAHLTVGFWYLLHHSPADAMNRVRVGITALNETMGVGNTDTSGYHETITRAYLSGIHFFIERHAARPPVEALTLLLATPLASSEWLHKHYSRDRLFSVQARKAWVEPDLLPMPGNAQF